MTKRQFKKLLNLVVILFFVFGVMPLNTHIIFAQENVDELNTKIDDKKSEIDELKRQSNIYKRNIQDIQTEALSLRNEIAILENKVAKLELDIQSTEAEIEKVNLEIEQTSRQVASKEEEINSQKQQLEEYIRVIYKNDQKNYFEILLLNDSFSEFFDQIKYTQDIQIELQDVIDEVELLKLQLEDQKNAQINQKGDLEILKKREEDQKVTLEETLQAKTQLLEDTENNETKFYSMYWQSKQEQSDINNELYNLEKKVREELDKQSENPDDMLLGSSGFIWPVADHSRGISAYFHDPDYPFRYIFEHPGIDVRAYQGTPIRAIDNGYVARAMDNGFGYSYIMLIHANGLSSVYGHISRIDVSQDTYVTKGQIIGLSGGMPGTIGAGKMTTGPHLHFEIRLNGIPVNPLQYLTE